jgi:hypothetical protein
MAIVEAGSTGSVTVRNPWSGQPTAVVDGGTKATVVASTMANTLAIPAMAGHWYAIVPAAAAGALPAVQVTGTPATGKKTFGPISIGL